MVAVEACKERALPLTWGSPPGVQPGRVAQGLGGQGAWVGRTFLGPYQGSQEGVGAATGKFLLAPFGNGGTGACPGQTQLSWLLHH